MGGYERQRFVTSLDKCCQRYKKYEPVNPKPVAPTTPFIPVDGECKSNTPCHEKCAVVQRGLDDCACDQYCDLSSVRGKNLIKASRLCCEVHKL
jgi:hypothetical protein